MTSSNHRWRRLGRIFCPDGRLPWMRTHAAVPFTEHLEGSLFRVYFSARDERNRARVGWLLLDVATRRVEEVCREPVLDLGPLGAYDDHGVVGSWLIPDGDRRLLYFSGMSLGRTVPFTFFVGLAVSEGGGPFRRISRAPLFPRDDVDPFLTGQLCILRDGDVRRMWYVSGDRWEERPEGPRHYYHIKAATSVDGVHWERPGHVAIDFEGDEHALARPCVLRDEDGYRMWFCRRGERYRLGYAVSEDAVHWERRDHAAGMEASASGWDSEMIAYPHVFDSGDHRYLLYNGNAYGRTGLGLAVLETS